MADKSQQITARKSVNFKEAESANNISSPDFNRQNISKNDDDLISSLQNRVENQRARQVFEWETARRQVLQINFA